MIAGAPAASAAVRPHAGRTAAARLSEAAAHRLAVAIVVLSAALSGIWVFQVPIFQGEDEPAHMDYVFSLYSAGHFIRGGDGVAAFIVHPYTKYLMRVSGFERIRRISGMRAEPGYGTRAFYARIDRRATPADPAASTHGRINWLVRAYPVGFYALEALWLRAVSLFTSSLLALFFAARLLCVAMMAAGLYFWYRLAAQLRMPPVLRLLLLVTGGFFPLTSYVSSYVQPDNLAFALVPAALYCAVRLRAPRAGWTQYALLGILLAALYLTKLQFWLPVCFAALLAICRTAGVARCAAVLVPCAGAAMLQHWISAGPASLLPPDVHVGLETAALQSALHGGPVAAAAYLAAETRAAFTDYFISGPFVESYWGLFGWRDTPLVIFNAAVENAIHIAVLCGTLATLALFARFAFANAARLRRLAFSDPQFAAFVAFQATMFALFIASYDMFQAQGRHEYPFVFASFAAGVWYAPRALGRAGRRVAVALGAVLALYSAVAALCALGAIHARYYSAPPAMPFAAVPAKGAIAGEAAGILYPPYSAGYFVSDGSFRFTFSRGTPLRLTGAAIDAAQARAARAAVVVDGSAAVPALSGNYYEGLSDSRYASSGFSATLDTSALAEGPHVVTAFAADGAHFRRIEPDRVVFITAAPQNFSAQYLRRLAHAPAQAARLKPVASCEDSRAGAFAPRDGHLLLSGTLAAQDAGGIAGVWALLDGAKAYPGRIDRARGNAVPFEIVIDARDVPPGMHDAAVYAIASASRASLRLGSVQRFRIGDRASGRSSWSGAALNPRCRDPLDQFYAAGEI